MVIYGVCSQLTTLHHPTMSAWGSGSTRRTAKTAYLFQRGVLSGITIRAMNMGICHIAWILVIKLVWARSDKVEAIGLRGSEWSFLCELGKMGETNHSLYAKNGHQYMSIYARKHKEPWIRTNMPTILVGMVSKLELKVLNFLLLQVKLKWVRSYVVMEKSTHKLRSVNVQ